jgi:hypothetical protein
VLPAYSAIANTCQATCSQDCHATVIWAFGRLEWGRLIWNRFYICSEESVKYTLK